MTWTNFLMDIAPIHGEHWTRPTRPRPIIQPEKVQDTYEQAKDSFLIVRDSLLKLENEVTDTASAAIQPGMVDMGNGSSSSLLLTVVVVAAALALCLAAAILYRRRLATM
jgi:hypothetical protein